MSARYDRYGDRTEVRETPAPTRDAQVIRLPLTGRHECVNGWLGDIDRPTPCPTCKPALAQRLREQRARWGA